MFTPLESPRVLQAESKRMKARNSLRYKLLRLKLGSGPLEMSKQTHITRSITVTTSHICSCIGHLTVGHFFSFSSMQRTSCAHSSSILKPYLPGEQYILQKSYHLCRLFAYSYDNSPRLSVIHTQKISHIPVITMGIRHPFSVGPGRRASY